MQLPILMAFLTLAVAFPKKGDGKKGDLDRDHDNDRDRDHDRDRDQDRDHDNDRDRDHDRDHDNDRDHDQDRDHDHDRDRDGNQPWDPNRHDGRNRTICISFPDGASWSALSPDGSKHSFDDMKFDGSTDGTGHGGW